MFRTLSHGSWMKRMAHSLGSWLGSPELRFCVVEISNGIVTKRCMREGRAFQDGTRVQSWWSLVGDRRSQLCLIANCVTLA
ncbi:hypothetical protein Hamer_G023845 [Homarus americanus]|uniref:Uncharacterized protein n=1 Tax=Homarus americanus TaxID=6706 RepID=A0A8J5TJE9_HOMAM|nr:hypothetical protein Hamer_G023845 [Homarus americanus]